MMLFPLQRNLFHIGSNGDNPTIQYGIPFSNYLVKSHLFRLGSHFWLQQMAVIDKGQEHMHGVFIMPWQRQSNTPSKQGKIMHLEPR